jgi:hypothetical protein
MPAGPAEWRGGEPTRSTACKVRAGILFSSIFFCKILSLNLSVQNFYVMIFSKTFVLYFGSSNFSVYFFSSLFKIFLQKFLFNFLKTFCSNFLFKFLCG